MDYILVVPTHRRVRTFLTKTYPFLLRTNAIKPIVWVNDLKDYSDYHAAFLEANIELEICIGGDTLKEKRNLIQDRYPYDTKIVMIDDDIKNIVVYDKDEAKGKRNLQDFNALVELSFSICTKYGTSFWGTYPIDNALFMKSVIRTNPSYIVGAFFGIINKKIFVETNYAEDYERTILHHLKEGKTIRLDFIGLTTRYYKTKGGLQETRTEEKNYNDKKFLADKYPLIVKMITKKNRAELSFIKSRGNTIPYEVPPEI